MDALTQLGVVGATPFVVQFLLDAAPDLAAKMDAGQKRVLSIAVGAVLGFLLYYQSGGVLALSPALYIAVVEGAIDGALATAGVSLVGKLAKKAK